MTPTAEILRTRLATPPPLHEGADGWVHQGIGWWRRRKFTRPDFAALAARLAAEHHTLRDLPEKTLEEKLASHRRQVRRHRHNCVAAAIEALPAVAEAARRELGLEPYPVQFQGALALLHGALAEMATGEGKTLTIALAAAPLGWTQLPVHILTANDYLARRDAANLARFYTRCGLDTGRVLAPMGGPERSENHAAGIVYTTGKELLADFLRDRLILGIWQDASRRIARRHFGSPVPATSRVCLRGLHHVIVDEADNLLIDEAVTPLIISRQAENPALVAAVQAAHRLAEGLEAGADYTVDSRRRDARLTETGLARIEREAATLDSAALEHAHWRRELVETALKARHFFLREKQYVVEDGAVIIVDEFTGRLMPGRQWKQGLHQAVEAKEGVPVTQPTESIAQLSYQSFFRLLPFVAGITGTARECAREIWAVHGRPFCVIPRHQPGRFQPGPPQAYAQAAEKWDAVVEVVARTHATGRPVLVGTRSIAASETLAQRLRERGIPFHLLNAVRHQEEAMIVERAGQRGAVTIATNMAGRGTDIRLGADVAGLGGLLVIATEPHRSGRIDRQLFGRAARQGDPGGGTLYLSLEDELLVDFLPAVARRVLKTALAWRWPGARHASMAACRWTQRRAERAAHRQRLAVLQQDRWVQDNLSAGRPDFIQ
jgi:preprotein translocase subunit SecA